VRWVPLLVAVALAVGPAAPGDAGTPWVLIMSPHDGAPLLGTVEVSARAGPPGEIRVVEFLVDGQPVGSLSRPPYDMTLDLGGENVPHVIEVVARDADGDEARAQVATSPVPMGTEYEVELQQLYVTATRDGERVLDLAEEDFEVEDEGRRQEIVTFARGDLPFTAAILIDSSASMQGAKLDAAVAGARAFLEGMQPLDQVQLTVFSDSLKIHTPIGAGPEVMLAGLGWVRAHGGTAIADHLWSALKLLETRQGRRVVVLLSDGVDTHSALPMEAVVEAARRSQALVYWIRLEGPRGAADASLSSAWRRDEEYRRALAALEQVVADSGGRIVTPGPAGEVRPVFLAILEELREQYVLGYYPSEQKDDGSWHRVEVEADAPGVEVRAARGYVDY